ncbi:MAG: hypothetical protein CMM56_01910 [Rhodospirillaceae bacterium]|nr:hypothetical protein [Rhodospirillaceae bacterium]
MRIINVLAVMIVLVTGSAKAQEAAPFRTRNLSPLISVFGLPVWESSLPGEGPTFGFVSDIANHYSLSRKGNEELILDGETWKNSVFYRYKILDEVNIGIELPFYEISGGFLDDTVDAWHSFFGMPDGKRNLREEDGLRYLYKDVGTSSYFLDQRSSGIGDIQISFSRKFNGLILKGTFKLPTGDKNILTGSGSTDISISVFNQKQIMFAGDPAGIFWGAGLIVMNEPKLFTDRVKDWAGFGTLGMGWRVLPRVGLKLQFDFHSRFYESELDEMGISSIQVNTGGWWEIDERRRLNIAIGEDLMVRTAPDITIHFDFSWDF